MTTLSATDLYIKNFNSKNNSTTLLKWVHEHPTAIKVTQAAAVCLGVASLIAIPFLLPAVGIGLTCVLAVGGGLLMITSLASWILLNYVTGVPYSMADHAYKETPKGRHCHGARLEYIGNVPVLRFRTKKPYEAGYAHGYLLGSQIHQLKKNVDRALHTFARQPRAKKLPRVMQELRQSIPKHYLQEMEGLCAGYKKWGQEAHVRTALTVDDLLLIHLMPDHHHFTPASIEKGIQPAKQPLTAGAFCTSIVHRDPQNRMRLERNMDWCSFGTGGGKQILFVWEEEQVAAFGTPGIIGVVSGWNAQHVCLAMNVAPGTTHHVRGLPAVLFNREVLKQAKKVSDVAHMTLRPLGAYHCILADPKDGCSISYYQGEGEIDHMRPVQGDEPVVTLNCQYPDCGTGFFNSERRNALLKRYFKGAIDSIPKEQLEWSKLLDNALQLTPLVNNYITLHNFRCDLEEGTVSLKWGNGYAASQPSAETLSMDSVFTAVIS